MAFETQTPPGPRSFVIYYAFLRLVAALTARGAREQIGIFTSESRLYPRRYRRHPVYAIVTLPRLRNGSHIYSNFILLPSSNRAAALRNEPRREIPTKRATGREGLSV